MSSPELKDLSPFGQNALALDRDFTELERLQGQLDRLDLESDNGLDRAKALLVRFGECGIRISGGIQGFAKSLEEARARAEKAAASVAERANFVQKRQGDCERLHAKFDSLNEKVKEMNAAMRDLRKPADEKLSAEERAGLKKRLPELDTQISELANEAMQIKDEAQSTKMRMLARNADSMGQTLSSARRKISAFIEAR